MGFQVTSIASAVTIPLPPCVNIGVPLKLVGPVKSVCINSKITIHSLSASTNNT